MLRPTAALLDPCRERVSEAHAAELLPRFDRAIARYPFAPPLLYSIGMICLQFGYKDLWEHYTFLAFSLPHVSHQDILFRAEAKIRLDDWSGWVDREARLFSPKEGTLWAPYARSVQWTTRVWDGVEAIDEMTLLVIADGGFGDCLQMARFIPQLARAAARVLFVVAPPCLSLLRHVVGRYATVICPDALPSERFHRYVWLMSLPAIYRSVPPFVAFTPPGEIRLPLPTSVHRIGVCWAGNSNQPSTAPDRSLSLDDLAPLLRRADVTYISLQVGPWAADAARYSRIRQPPIALTTFAQTANVIADLDRVISIDTAVAHLAASLGVPTYLLLHCAGEFRWGMNETTAWYPSMRIVRQPARGDWRGVVSRVTNLLDAEDGPK